MIKVSYFTKTFEPSYENVLRILFVIMFVQFKLHKGSLNFLHIQGENSFKIYAKNTWTLKKTKKTLEEVLKT